MRQHALRLFYRMGMSLVERNPAQPSLDRWIEFAGVAGLCLFAAGGLQFPDVAGFGAAVMVAVVLLRYRGSLLAISGKPLLLLPLLFSAYVLLRAVAHYLRAPAAAEDIGEWTAYYVVASGLPAIIVAILLGVDRARMVLILNIALAALLFAVVRNMSVAQLVAYQQGERAFFDLGNAAGLYITTAILGIFLLAPWETGTSKRGSWRHRLVVTYYLVALFLLSQALIWHQNRSALLAAMVVFPVAALAYLRLRRARAGRVGGQYPRWLFAWAMLCLATALFIGGGEIERRFVDVFDAARLVLDVDEEALPSPAIAERISLWRTGWHSAIEDPLLGKGPGSISELVQHDPKISRYSHLHNLYLQLLVETGLVGLGLYCAILALLLRVIRRTDGSAGVPDTMRLFILGAFALFLLVNLTQVRIDNTHAMSYVTLLVALAMTCVPGIAHDRGNSC